MSEAESSAGRPDRPEKRPRSWRRFFIRLFFRIFVALLLLLTTAVVYILFSPISNARLDSALKEAWLDGTGIRIDYTRAEVTVATGLVRVEEPTLLDPENGQALTSLAACDIRVDLWSVIRALTRKGEHAKVRRITLQGPLDLQFHEDRGQFELSPPLRRLVELIRSRLDEERPSDGVQADIESVMLSDVDFYLDRIGGEQVVRLGAVTNTFVLTEFQAGASLPKVVNLVGKLVGSGGSTGLSIQMSADESDEAMRLKVRVNPVDSRKDLLGRLPMDFQSGEIQATGLLSRQGPGDWILRAESSTPHLVLVGAGVQGVDHRVDDAMINTLVRWRNEAKKLDVLSLKVKTSDSLAEARGELGLEEPYPYHLELERLELRGQSVALAERVLFDENRITTPDRGMLRVVGQVDGRASVLKPESVQGEFSVEDLTLLLPNLPEPVQAVRLKARITPEEVQITEGGALVQGLPVFLKGAMKGRPLVGEIANAQFEWAVSGELAGLSGMLDGNAQTADWKVGIRGGVSGSGTIRVKQVKLGHWGQMLEKANIRGRLVFSDAEVRTDQLKPSIQKVRGTLDFDRNKATLKELSGEVEDVPFQMSGSIQGKDVFWKDAKLNVAMQAGFALEHLARYVEWVGRKAPDMPELSGRVQLTGRLQGPLDQLDEATVSGSLRGADVRFRPDGPHLGEVLHLPVVEAQLDKQQIRIESASGTWGETAVTLGGEISPQRGRLDVKLDGELAKVKPLFPKIGHEFEGLAGNVAIVSRFDLSRKPSTPQLKNLLDAWEEEQARQKEGGDLESLAWDIQLTGEAKIDGGQMVHQQMPETARLSEIYGVLKFDLDKTWSEEPVFLKPSTQSETSQLMVVIGYPRDEKKNLLLDFKLRGSKLNVDDWVQNWRKRRPWDPQSPPAKRPLDLKISVDVVSDEVVYRGLEGTELTGTIGFESFGRRNRRLFWEDARARINGGSVLVNGQMVVDGDREVTTHQIEGTNLEVADVSAAFLKNSKMISSGRVSGTLNLTKPGSKGTPLDGSGHFDVTESRFISNAIFSGIGSLLKLDTLFKDISFTKVAGDFKVEKGVIMVDKGNPVIFENPSALHPLSLTVSGQIDAEQKADLLLSLQFFPLVGNIPIVGEIWDALTGRIVRLNVTGPLDDPWVLPAPPVL